MWKVIGGAQCKGIPYDLFAPLGDFDFTIHQGNNGTIWALIAADAGNYQFPTSGFANLTTREKLIAEILDKQQEPGGWAISGKDGGQDVDITAMAIQALAIYRGRPEVSQAIEDALDWLSNQQNDNGGFSSWGMENVQSAAQVVVALTALGYDPVSESRFVKPDGNPLTSILSFYVAGGGFYHSIAGQANLMATDQATYPLIAYDRFLKSQNRLYDMTDVFSSGGEPDPAFTRGDINGDGSVNANDLTALRLHFAGRNFLAKTSEMDINNDGNVNANDLTAFRLYFAGRFTIPQ